MIGWAVLSVGIHKGAGSTMVSPTAPFAVGPMDSRGHPAVQTPEQLYSPQSG